ncbi:MAG: hypothetical protein M1839_003302 [Geoglossum umbratile]|nr:MAG: hypothetical protein M1839_003302 [Geoglossum umbratile]
MPFIQKGYDRSERFITGKRPAPSAPANYQKPELDEKKRWVSHSDDPSLPAMEWDGEEKAWKELDDDLTRKVRGRSTKTVNSQVNLLGKISGISKTRYGARRVTSEV